MWPNHSGSPTLTNTSILFTKTHNNFRNEYCAECCPQRRFAPAPLLSSHCWFSVTVEEDFRRFQQLMIWRKKREQRRDTCACLLKHQNAQSGVYFRVLMNDFCLRSYPILILRHQCARNRPYNETDSRLLRRPRSHLLSQWRSLAPDSWDSTVLLPVYGSYCILSRKVSKWSYRVPKSKNQCTRSPALNQADSKSLGVYLLNRGRSPRMRTAEIQQWCCLPQFQVHSKTNRNHFQSHDKHVLS